MTQTKADVEQIQGWSNKGRVKRDPRGVPLTPHVLAFVSPVQGAICF